MSQDVQVLGIEIFRMRMADMRREDRGQPRMVVFRKPHREDIELLIAGEHRVERGEIAKRLFHDLCPCFHEDAMHSGSEARSCSGLRPQPAGEARTRPVLSCRASG